MSVCVYVCMWLCRSVCNRREAQQHEGSKWCCFGMKDHPNPNPTALPIMDHAPGGPLEERTERTSMVWKTKSWGSSCKTHVSTIHTIYSEVSSLQQGLDGTWSHVIRMVSIPWEPPNHCTAVISVPQSMVSTPMCTFFHWWMLSMLFVIFPWLCIKASFSEKIFLALTIMFLSQLKKIFYNIKINCTVHLV